MCYMCGVAGVVAGVATSAMPMVHGGIIVALYIVRREWKRRQTKNLTKIKCQICEER